MEQRPSTAIGTRAEPHPAQVRRLAALSALAAILLGPTSAPAHEGGVDTRGTITEVRAEHVVVRTSSGQDVRYALTSRTEVLMGSSPAKLSDVRVGDRAVIHGRRSAAELEAVSIRLARRAAPEAP